VSLNRACKVMSVSKTAYYYQPKKRAGEKEIEVYLAEQADAHKRWGFDKMMQKAKLDGKPWNHKRVHRIYRELGLNIRVKPRKRLPAGEAKVLMQPLAPNESWSADFMSDVLFCGQKFRTFNVIDDYNRAGLLIEPSFSLPAKRVTQLLDEVAAHRGYPNMIRVDNGPEFRSSEFQRWAKENHVLIHYIQPGKPAQNGYIERFNRTFRDEILDTTIFNTVKEVRVLSKQWLVEYNNERPHEALRGLPPVLFAKWRKKLTGKQGENSTFR